MSTFTASVQYSQREEKYMLILVWTMFIYYTHLVVGGRDDPWVLIMKLHCSDVIQVTEKREETTPELVVPHLRRRTEGKVESADRD